MYAGKGVTCSVLPDETRNKMFAIAIPYLNIGRRYAGSRCGRDGVLDGCGDEDDGNI